jgi:UDP-N-acetylmuramate dehydrogenase
MVMSVIAKEVKGKLLLNESLASYTSWRTGGQADYLYLPADSADLSVFLQRVPSDLPVTWLGLGSNTLVRDQGVPGVVILTQGLLNQLSVEGDVIRAEAGVASAQLARFSARLGLMGLEFLAGVPGTVGGALAMNAGCFGSETWSSVLNATRR